MSKRLSGGFCSWRPPRMTFFLERKYNRELWQIDDRCAMVRSVSAQNATPRKLRRCLLRTSSHLVSRWLDRRVGALRGRLGFLTFAVRRHICHRPHSCHSITRSPCPRPPTSKGVAWFDAGRSGHHPSPVQRAAQIVPASEHQLQNPSPRHVRRGIGLID